MVWLKLVAAAVISAGAGAALAWWGAVGTESPSALRILAFYAVLLAGVPAVVALAVARPGYSLITGAVAGAAGVTLSTLTWVAVVQPETDMGYWAYGLLAAWLLVGVVIGGAVGVLVCGIAGAAGTGDVDVPGEDWSA